MTKIKRTIVEFATDNWTVYAVAGTKMVNFYAKKNDNDIALFSLGGQQMSIDEVDEDFISTVFTDENIEDYVGMYEKAVCLIADAQMEALTI